MVDLKRLMFDMSLSQRDLAQIIGTAQSEISHFANGRRDLKGQYLQSLIAHFGQETIDAYTRPDKPFEGITQTAEVTILSNETVEEIKEEIREKEIKTTIVLSQDIIRDPKVNLKEAFKAGDLDDLAKPTQDILPLHHAKVYTFCDDMEPEIRAREAILVRLLPRDISIVPGDMYFIDLPSGGIIRYIVKEENNKLYLKARNSAYGDIIVNREEVQSLALVVQILRTPRSMSLKESTAAELLISKDRHLDRLLDQLEKGGERERQLIDYITKDK